MSSDATARSDAPQAEAELRSGAGLELPDGVTLPWLVPTGVMAHWQQRPALWRLPGAPPWLRGVTYWLGRLAPVFDVALWLAPARPARACEHLLLLALKDGPAALRVRAAPELLQLSPVAADAVPAQAPPALLPYLQPRVQRDGSVVHEFQVESWLMRARASAPAYPAPGAEEKAA